MSTTQPPVATYQKATVGGAPRTPGHQIIGADARLYAGAVIVGPVRPGDGVIIGANGVAAHDVPDRASVGVDATVTPPDS